MREFDWRSESSANSNECSFNWQFLEIWPTFEVQTAWQSTKPRPNDEALPQWPTELKLLTNWLHPPATATAAMSGFWLASKALINGRNRISQLIDFQSIRFNRSSVTELRLQERSSVDRSSDRHCEPAERNKVIWLSNKPLVRNANLNSDSAFAAQELRCLSLSLTS